MPCYRGHDIELQKLGYPIKLGLDNGKVWKKAAVNGISRVLIDPRHAWVNPGFHHNVATVIDYLNTFGVDITNERKLPGKYSLYGTPEIEITFTEPRRPNRAQVDEAISRAIKEDLENPQGWDEFFEWLILQGVDVADPQAVYDAVEEHRKKFLSAVARPVIDWAINSVLSLLDTFPQTGFKKLINEYSDSYFRELSGLKDPKWMARMQTPRSLKLGTSAKDKELFNAIIGVIESRALVELDDTGLDAYMTRDQVLVLFEWVVQHARLLAKDKMYDLGVLTQ